jgi:hypothetical protein
MVIVALTCPSSLNLGGSLSILKIGEWITVAGKTGTLMPVCDFSRYVQRKTDEMSL